jgi:hypothetical protein
MSTTLEKPFDIKKYNQLLNTLINTECEFTSDANGEIAVCVEVEGEKHYMPAFENWFSAKAYMGNNNIVLTKKVTKYDNGELVNYYVPVQKSEESARWYWENEWNNQIGDSNEDWFEYDVKSHFTKVEKVKDSERALLKLVTTKKVLIPATDVEQAKETYKKYIEDVFGVNFLVGAYCKKVRTIKTKQKVA